MAGYNRVIMIGNLTKDPELKPVGTQSVCKMTIASNKQYKNKQTGAAIQEVCFIDIEVWGAQADSCKTYLQKGKPILVEGRLKLDTWKDQEGQTKSKHSIVAEKIVFLGSAQDNQNSDDLITDDSHQNQYNNGPLVKTSSDKIRPSYKEKTSNQKKTNFTDNPPFIEDDLPF